LTTINRQSFLDVGKPLVEVAGNLCPHQ